jgi:hypothetical protein
VVLEPKKGFFLKYNVLASFRKSFEKWDFRVFSPLSTLSEKIAKITGKQLFALDFY